MDIATRAARARISRGAIAYLPLLLRPYVTKEFAKAVGTYCQPLREDAG